MLKSQLQSAIRYYIGNASADVDQPMKDALSSISSIIPLRVLASGSVSDNTTSLEVANIIGLLSFSLADEYLEIVDFENIDRWIALANIKKLACRKEGSTIRFNQKLSASDYEITYEASHVFPSSDLALTVPAHADHLLVLLGSLCYFRSLLFTTVTKRENVPDVTADEIRRLIRELNEQISQEIASLVLL